MRTSLSLLPVFFSIAALHGCTSIDAEREELNGALRNARQLATEIHVWSHQTATAVSETASETISSYKSRAEQVLDTLTGASNEARRGMDLAGVEQALSEIADFDTSRIQNASQEGRASVVNQFGGLAVSLNTAIDRVHIPN